MSYFDPIHILSNFSANAKIPPGEFDIYTFPQLHDSLAQLITDNLEVRTWLFKMDHEFDGEIFFTIFEKLSHRNIR